MTFSLICWWNASLCYITCGNMCSIYWVMMAAFRVVSLVPFNFYIGTIIWQINSERYILPMTTYLPIVPMTYQWLAYWPMVIYMELLWIFISIKFHIADPCSLSHGQTIKHTGHGQLQYIRIYLEKCRDENYMNIFKIEKPPIPGLQYSTVQLYHLNTYTRQNNCCTK